MVRAVRSWATWDSDSGAGMTEGGEAEGGEEAKNDRPVEKVSPPTSRRKA